jgi:hypothetical protein
MYYLAAVGLRDLRVYESNLKLVINNVIVFKEGLL